MKLYLSDLYRVEVHYPLDEVQNDILYYLYQPLIGTNALQLYMMLIVEGKRMNRFLTPSSLSRLTSFLSMSLIDIEKALKALEGIGLLKTFVKHDQDITQYVYQIQSPLSLKAFFKNQILLSLIQESLSIEDFQKTVQYFKISIEDLSQFDEVTASFKDVFTIDHRRKTGKLLKLNEDFKDSLHKNIEVEYDQELLMKALSDYQLNKSLFNSDDMKYIGQLGIVYSVDAFTLAGLIKDSMNSKQLDRDLLKINIKKYCEIDNLSSLKEVHYKQPLQYLTQETKQTPLVLHMKYLDTLTPYELLKEKQGGKEPVFHDLMIVETLMMQLGLRPAVVNVLIEYVLGKNSNRLSKRYCEAIGSSWARKNIETAMEAYKELMSESEVEAEIVEESEVVEVKSDELASLLNQLKEGQL
ncbi:MAG: DnaD domain protein [Coprobacillus sp.]